MGVGDVLRLIRRFAAPLCEDVTPDVCARACPRLMDGHRHRSRVVPLPAEGRAFPGVCGAVQVRLRARVSAEVCTVSGRRRLRSPNRPAKPSKPHKPVRS
jgi:hypothetical protein